MVGNEGQWSGMEIYLFSIIIVLMIIRKYKSNRKYVIDEDITKWNYLRLLFMIDQDILGFKYIFSQDSGNGEILYFPFPLCSATADKIEISRTSSLWTPTWHHCHNITRVGGIKVLLSLYAGIWN